MSSPIRLLENLPAPAKLNLMLHITGQDTRGYHLLQTVFQLLDFGDSLSFDRRQDTQVKIKCNLPELETTDNLIIKAAEIIKPFATQFFGVDIVLEKRLPMGGGVGGGSSDCATTLLALNHIWKCHLSEEKLMSLGLQLGADVPLFIKGQTAWAEGVGEQLTPIELPEIWYLVVYPDCFVSTAKIFSDKALTRDCEISTIRDFLAQGGPHRGNNVMQPVVLQHYPNVKRALDWLLKFCPDARMTGSGSCVFATFDNEREARKIALRCDWPHFVAKGINQSPVTSKLF
ncbi:MAG: 4-(cytidine 5'-diphospho)-2-C-methyl-D-erythritol kinase [Gammaproteobacteria bacterium]|nr:4-(cytidine 5'-diphospho)-2-C-methyl-D-erythritol kinase [Gammaproteobacteria bacterium]